MDAAKCPYTILLAPFFCASSQELLFSDVPDLIDAATLGAGHLTVLVIREDAMGSNQLPTECHK